MSNLETAKAVLAKASLFDQSFATPDLGIALAWAEALGNLDRDDALATVTAHYSEPAPRRIMPGDVIAGVKRIRTERLRDTPSNVLDPHHVDPDDVVTYLDAGRQRRAAIASGQPVELEPEQATTRPVEQLLAETLASLPQMPEVTA